jgi:hypothetical protein
LVGTGATAAIAIALPGPPRWWALGLGPALSLALAYMSVLLVVRLIDPAEGSGFLLGGAAMGLYLAVATVYYPALAVVGIWRLWGR